MTAYLGPCDWDADKSVVEVKARGPQARASQNHNLKKGVVVRVEVEDASGELRRWGSQAGVEVSGVGRVDRQVGGREQIWVGNKKTWLLVLPKGEAAQLKVRAVRAPVSMEVVEGTGRKAVGQGYGLALGQAEVLDVRVVAVRR